MNRQDNINKFLLYCKKLIMSNRSSMSRYDFYDLFQRYGISNYDVAPAYGQIFSSWLDRYKETDNINVYVSEQQRGFLQFSNSHHKSNHLKIYLSISPQHLEKVGNIIFDYLAEHDLGHQSKVAKMDRSDVIVLRLEDLNDAPFVLNYINSNPYIKSVARAVNPFSMDCGVTGITYDGLLSYNMTVSLMLENYFNEKINSNTLNDVSVSDFKNFVNTYYQDVFVNRNKLNDFINQEEVKDEISRIKRSKPYENRVEEKILINYMHVINNLNTSLDSNNYSLLTNSFKKYKHDINDENLINSFSDSLNKIKRKGVSYEEETLKEYICESSPNTI